MNKKMNKKMNNKIIILVGSTASGKTTIQKELTENGFHKVISATTREPRIKDNEKNGVDYFFYKENEFNEMIKNNDFAEYEKFGNNFYGTPWKSLEEKETIPCLIVEPKGAKNLKNILKEKKFNPIVVWVNCPIEDAIERVKKRDEKNPEDLKKRLKLMEKEESEWHNYMKYDIILNGLENPKKNVEILKRKLGIKKTYSQKI